MNMGLAELIDKASSLHQPSVLVTLVAINGSVPQKAGAHMLVEAGGKSYGTVGGGQLEYHLIQLSQQILADYSPPRLVELNLAKDLHMACGGSVSAFLEPLGLAEKVVIFGCGHVARQTAPLLVSVGFDVTVVDDRSEWADSGAFPDSVTVVCQDLVQFARQTADSANERTWVLIMSRGHTLDFEVLAEVLKGGFRYIGVMSSMNKRTEFYRRLAEAGFEPAALQKLRIPLGIEIGSKTPPEIAVSIAAELISLRNLGTKP